MEGRASVQVTSCTCVLACHPGSLRHDTWRTVRSANQQLAERLQSCYVRMHEPVCVHVHLTCSTNIIRDEEATHAQARDDAAAAGGRRQAWVQGPTDLDRHLEHIQPRALSKA